MPDRPLIGIGARMFPSTIGMTSMSDFLFLALGLGCIGLLCGYALLLQKA